MNLFEDNHPCDFGLCIYTIIFPFMKHFIFSLKSLNVILMTLHKKMKSYYSYLHIKN